MKRENFVTNKNGQEIAITRKVGAVTLEKISELVEKSKKVVQNKQYRRLAVAGVVSAMVATGGTAAIKTIVDNIKHDKVGIGTEEIVVIKGNGKIASGEDAKNNSDIYLYNIETDDEFVLWNDSGVGVDLFLDRSSEIFALASSSLLSENEWVPVTLVDSEGKMQSGFLDSDFLKAKPVQKIEETDYSSFDQVCMVSAKSGAWLRKSTDIDKNNEDAILLEPGSYVCANSTKVISKSNNYTWEEVLYFDGDNINYGYMASEYLINSDFSRVQGKKFLTNVDDLSLMEESNMNSDVIASIDSGAEVIVVPNVESESDGKYDWLYVATKVGDEIKLGFLTATRYFEDGSYESYLDDMKSEILLSGNNSEKSVMKKVSNNGMDLKLMSSKSKDSKVLARIEDGTVIHTTKEAFERALDSEEIDGERWIQIQLLDGEKGYVQVDKLTDYVVQKDINLEKSKYVFANGNGTITQSYDGYLGMDVNSPSNLITPGKLGEFLDNKVEYTDRNFENGSVYQAPSFVYIKLGATGWGDEFHIANDNDREAVFSKVKSLTMVCDERQIPYGIYYYSQAINEKERDAEVAYIEEFYDFAGSMEYNLLPLAIDVEDGGDKYNNSPENRNYHGRTWHHSQEHGKEDVTYIVNSEMNILRKKLGIEVNMYTAQVDMTEIIDFGSFDEQNKKNLWLVQPNSDHTDRLEELYTDALDHSKVMQIALDQVYLGVGIDLDFVKAEYLEELIDEKNNQDFIKQSMSIQNNKKEEDIAVLKKETDDELEF